MNPTLDKLYNVIALGQLSPPLAECFDCFSISIGGFVGKSFWVQSTKSRMPRLPQELFSHQVDWTWLFVNDSEISAPAIVDVISLSRQLSPIHIHSFLDGANQDTEDLSEWPVDLLHANQRMVMTRYTELSFNSLQLFHALIPHNERAKSSAGQRRGEIHEVDPLYKEAQKILQQNGQPSISLVQRSLKISYTHAAALVAAFKDEISSRRPSELP